MRSLIRVFAGRTNLYEDFIERWFISIIKLDTASTKKAQMSINAIYYKVMNFQYEYFNFYTKVKWNIMCGFSRRADTLHFQRKVKLFCHFFFFILLWRENIPSKRALGVQIDKQEVTKAVIFLMTDSICHSSLPRTVLEKVTDYYSISYSSAHKCRPNVSMCVY